jgi:hypothetical protein
MRGSLVVCRTRPDRIRTAEGLASANDRVRVFPVGMLVSARIHYMATKLNTRNGRLFVLGYAEERQADQHNFVL